MSWHTLRVIKHVNISLKKPQMNIHKRFFIIQVGYSKAYNAAFILETASVISFSEAA
jgi:hypothetical protein